MPLYAGDQPSEIAKYSERVIVRTSELCKPEFCKANAYMLAHVHVLIHVFKMTYSKVAKGTYEATCKEESQKSYVFEVVAG